MRKKYFVAFILYSLLVYAYYLYFSLNNTNFSGYEFYFLFGLLGIVSFFLMLLWFFRYKKIMLLINYLLMLVYGFYFVTQQIYYRGFDQYYRLATAFGLNKELQGVASSAFELVHIQDYIPFVLATLLLVFGFLFIGRYKPKVKKINLIPAILSLAFCFLLSSISIYLFEKQLASTVVDVFTSYKTDYYLFEKVTNTNQFTQTFGMNALLYRDIKELFHQGKNESSLHKIDEYFAQSNAIQQNEMTGIFKDKNILFIQAESLVYAGIHPELTPTLNWFLNQGIVMEGYNTPILIGSTSDTEFMVNTSIIPVTDGLPVCYQYVENSYRNTLAKNFTKHGYKAYAYHNNYAEYYNRHITFPKYGYKFHDSAALGFDNFVDDTLLSDNVAYISIGAPKFISYWVTVSGHQPYELNTYGSRNQEDIERIQKMYPDLQENYVAYLAKSMDLDKALANIINILDSAKQLENTVFVVFGDHKAKGLDFSKESNFCQNLNCDSKIDYTPWIIFNTAYASQNGLKLNQTKSTALDIFPTIVNLWDLPMDQNYLFGKDVFDPTNEGLQFFSDGLWITNHFSYNFIEKQLITDDKQLSPEEINLRIEKIQQKMDIAYDVLKSNYFEEDLQ